jgi:hypothetical protein
MGMGVVAACLISGCASLSLPGSGSKNGDDLGVAVSQCSVELHGSDHKTKQIDVPISAQTRVQDVLDQTKALRRFGKADVYILRRSQQDPNQLVRLTSDIDSKTRRITLETDYAMLPGDRLVVAESSESLFDKAVSAMVPSMMR